MYPLPESSSSGSSGMGGVEEPGVASRERLLSLCRFSVTGNRPLSGHGTEAVGLLTQQRADRQAQVPRTVTFFVQKHADTATVHAV